MKIYHYLLASALCLAVAIGACNEGPTDVATETGSSDTNSLGKKEGVNVDLCHATHYSDDGDGFAEGDEAFVWISVDPKAVNKHKNQHGDGDRVGSTDENPGDPPPSSLEYCDRDDDVDGIADDDDNCPETPNNAQDNNDADSHGDACDNCPDDDNEDQADADGDGVGDACDICPGSDDSVDTDADGVPDGCDVCEGSDTSGDSDSDGVCDDIDTCPNDADNDIDGDGLCADVDVCPNEGELDCEGFEDFNFTTGCCELVEE